MDQDERLIFLRESMNVERCHTTPHFGSYTLGQHIAGMLTLLEVLYVGAPPPALWRAILLHDAHERWTGDVPASMRKMWPEAHAALHKMKMAVDVIVSDNATGALTTEERGWLRGLDALDLYLWCREQQALGNRHVEFMMGDAYNMAVAEEVPEPIRDAARRYVWRRHHEF